MVYEEDPIKRWLQENHPEHINGYNEGWLTLKGCDCGNYRFVHVFSDEDGLIGTVTIWIGGDED